MTELKCPETWVNENDPTDTNLYGRLMDFCLIAVGRGALELSDYANEVVQAIAKHVSRMESGLTAQFNNGHLLLNSSGIRWFLSRYPEQFDQFSNGLIRKIAEAQMREVIATQQLTNAQRQLELDERQRDNQRIAQLEAEVGQLLKRIDELEDKLDEQAGIVQHLRSDNEARIQDAEVAWERYYSGQGERPE